MGAVAGGNVPDLEIAAAQLLQAICRSLPAIATFVSLGVRTSGQTVETARALCI